MGGTAVASAVVLADRIPGARTRDVLLTVAYAAGIGISAQLVVALPFTPVPITGQTFAVLLGAATLGRDRAAVGAGLYLAAGLAGVPWFTTASPVTLGYIAGFVFAAAAVGRLAERGWDRSRPRTVAAMITGNLVIYAVGVPYLALTGGMGLPQALELGLAPFLAGDAVKIAAAAALLPAIWRLLPDPDLRTRP